MPNVVYTFHAVPPGQKKSFFWNNAVRDSAYLFQAWARMTTPLGISSFEYQLGAAISSVRTETRPYAFYPYYTKSRIVVTVENTGSFTSDIDVVLEWFG